MLNYQDRPLPEPLITPENQAYFDACAKGSLLLRQCKSCGKTHFHPRPICPLCGSDQTEWFEASQGKQELGGEIYSYSVLRKGVDTPYCLAYVDVALGDGQNIRMQTNIVDCDFDSLRIGQKVTLCFKATAKGVHLPMFRPS